MARKHEQTYLSIGVVNEGFFTTVYCGLQRLAAFNGGFQNDKIHRWSRFLTLTPGDHIYRSCHWLIHWGRKIAINNLPLRSKFTLELDISWRHFNYLNYQKLVIKSLSNILEFDTFQNCLTPEVPYREKFTTADWMVLPNLSVKMTPRIVNSISFNQHYLKYRNNDQIISWWCLIIAQNVANISCDQALMLSSKKPSSLPILIFHEKTTLLK